MTALYSGKVCDMAQFGQMGSYKRSFKVPWIGTLFKNLGKAHFGEIDISSHDGYGIYLPLRLLKGLHKIKNL